MAELVCNLFMQGWVEGTLLVVAALIASKAWALHGCGMAVLLFHCVLSQMWFSFSAPTLPGPHQTHTPSQTS